MTAQSEKKLYDSLNELGISYTRHEHPPVYTVDEAEKYWQDIEGTHCKNLFLRNSKGNQHFLVVLEHSKRVDLNQLAEKTGAGKLSFASAGRLEKYLGLETGAVSPFGLINDTNKEVQLVLDKDLKRSEQVNFHPNVNTATLTVTYSDFERFLEHCGNPVLYL
jgi:Ala-tRNA(Pro) deacylase